MGSGQGELCPATGVIIPRLAFFFEGSELFVQMKLYSISLVYSGCSRAALFEEKA